MIAPRHITVCACLLLGALTAWAQPGPGAPPTPPLTASPVELFRRLMATNDLGREQFLASKSPQARRVIEAKLREYAAIPAEQRDARLHALQLRWYTQQLMRTKPADRVQRLTQLPEADRAVIAGRIGRFSILPPLLQQAVLTNQLAINVFAEEGSLRLSTDPRREQQFERLTQFVEMPSAEQKKVMLQLTATEHDQMQATLSTFTKLSKEERREAMEGFKKFAALSDHERASFLSTAKRWSEMSEPDRQFWRNIVAALQRSRSAPPMPVNTKPTPNGPRVATN